MTAEYVTRDVQGEPRADGEEALELNYFALSEVPLNCTPSVMRTLQRLEAKLSKGEL